jgi:hypothetical protein
MLDGLLGRVLNGPIISTLFRYALVFIGGTVVAQGWFTVDEWAQLSAAVTAFGLAIWGVIEARKSKVVVNGTRVPLTDLPPTTQNAVVSSVAAVEKARSA